MADLPLPETCCPVAGATVWIRLGQAAYLGPSLRLAPHAGSVDCVAVGIEEPFTLRADSTGERRVHSALIPARTRHHIIAEGRILFCYLEPHTGLAAHIRDQMRERTSSVHFGHPGELALVRHLRDNAAPDPAHLFDLLGTPSSVHMDERIREALHIMRAHPDGQLSAADVAGKVHLSTSRFLHLFATHARTSFRRYRLWTRMVRAAAAVSTGQNLTTAAAEAGFASPAHFSDSFRQMFGLPASRVFSGNTRIIADPD
jgi:AraC-like DNA-binding protein